jgi:hypothetical protein
MADTNTTAEQGTQVQANGATEDTPAKLYATKAEAETNKPVDAPKSAKPFEVTVNGTVAGWVIARGYDNALALWARTQGATVSTGTNTAPVTKEVVNAKVMEMSDDEFKALVAARKAAAKKS